MYVLVLVVERCTSVTQCGSSAASDVDKGLVRHWGCAWRNVFSRYGCAIGGAIFGGEAIEERPEAIATKEDGGDQYKQDFGRFEFMGVNFSGLIKAPCFLGEFLSAGGASG